MRTTLWTDSEASEVDPLIAMATEDGVVLVAERPQGGLSGFAEVGLRPYAEGCLSTPVAYLEGIWVDPDVRRQGTASALVGTALSWAAALGLEELASDCQIDNDISLAFHLANGFVESERIICFRQTLPTRKQTGSP